MSHFLLRFGDLPKVSMAVFEFLKLRETYQLVWASPHQFRPCGTEIKYQDASSREANSFRHDTLHCETFRQCLTVHCESKSRAQLATALFRFFVSIQRRCCSSEGPCIEIKADITHISCISHVTSYITCITCIIGRRQFYFLQIRMSSWTSSWIFLSLRQKHQSSHHTENAKDIASKLPPGSFIHLC